MVLATKGSLEVADATTEVVDMLEPTGTDGRGLYLVDKEIGKLVAKEAAGGDHS